jgi:U3 small nucleolar RNA-associated protein 14
MNSISCSIHLALQIQRAILYDHVKKDVSKWNSVVYHNRLAEQLVFPLEAGKKLPKPTAKDRMEDFVVITKTY